MPVGPGKYDKEATRARESAQAQGVILVVVGGAHGSGFSVQVLDPGILVQLPTLLRTVADAIDKERST